jgi:exosortase
MPETEKQPGAWEGGSAGHGHSAADSHSTTMIAEKLMSPGPPLGRHIWFALLCIASGIAFWKPLSVLVHLAYASDYYSHTVVVPLLAGYLIYRKRHEIFAFSRTSARLGIPILLAGALVFVLQMFGSSWISKQGRFSLVVFAVVLLWMGAFALCYGRRPFRAALFPLLLLLLTIPFPMTAMDDFIHLTRVGSTEVASAIFTAFGVPVFRDGFLFVLPGVSIEVAKECSGIHSTMALFILTLTCGYLFLRSAWKRALLLLFVFPIVSLTNGLRIATLTLLAEYVDKNIFNTSLHRNGGIFFFLVAFALIAVTLRLISAKQKRGFKQNKQDRGTASFETTQM